jgi:hypothetical protein
VGCLFELLTVWLGPELFAQSVAGDRPWWVRGCASTGCMFGIGIVILLLIAVASKLGR